MQTDKGIVLATALIEDLRRQLIILPVMKVIEDACAEAITRANRRIYAALTDSLSEIHFLRLDNLLKRKDTSSVTWLGWLRQSPKKPNSRHMLEHIERLKALQAIDLPVAGDPTYGHPGELGLERQFLHAARLAFEHPFTGAQIDVRSPLPADLVAALAAARP